MICKLLERLIKDHMVDFLVKHKLLNSSQHGFLKARSCLTNMLYFLEEITKWIDVGSPVDIIYLDTQILMVINNIYFSLKKDSRTRGHEVKLVKDQCRLDIRKHSFSQRTINEWNKLSTDCVTASSVNMFKNKVDTNLRRAGYK